MAEANMYQGFMVHEQMYRVPDLLTEEQLKEYFLDTFNARITIEHLGPEGSNPDTLGPTGQQVGDTETTPVNEIKDPDPEPSDIYPPENTETTFVEEEESA